jgi:catalase
MATKKTQSKTNLLGEGGELQQQATAGHPVMTTNQGTPLSDNQNTLRQGALGPALLEDFILREKITHFDHERIPERVVHARGTGAKGYFELHDSLARHTIAAVLSDTGVRTPVFCRFSTVAGGAGSVDTPRDVRGFAVKFYTAQGNWDLVGNNIPVFFIQDAMKFPDLVHAVKMEPDCGYPQAASAHDTFWDFISLMPESMHMIMWAMSDRTLPRTLRHMDGFGVHSFRLVDAYGASTFVKFHWRPTAGLAATPWDEALKLQSADNDFHRRDLHEAIARGDFPAWDLAVQLFTEEQAQAFPFDHLDPTKLIPEELIPLRTIGRMTLNEWPTNFFAETEQVAFCPAHLIPGLDFSDDPLLQGRLFSYTDTQLSRLGGPNFHQLPVNAPRCPVHNLQRDGLMQMAVPKGKVNYEPSSLATDSPRASRALGLRPTPSAPPDGTKGRQRSPSFQDHYSQARQFLISLTDSERAHLATALVFELGKVKMEMVRTRVMSLLGNVDVELARRVADGLCMPLPAAAPLLVPVQALPPSPALSLQRQERPQLAGKCVGLLYGPGSDAELLARVQEQVVAHGGVVKCVAPAVGGARLSNKRHHAADEALMAAPSALFDAVAVVLSVEQAQAMALDAAACDWVRDAYGHLKALLVDAGGQALLDLNGLAADEAVLDACTQLDEFVQSAGARHWAREPRVRRLC